MSPKHILRFIKAIIKLINTILINTNNHYIKCAFHNKNFHCTLPATIYSSYLMQYHCNGFRIKIKISQISDQLLILVFVAL